MEDRAGLHMGRRKQGEGRPCQGLQAGSPQLLPGTFLTGDCKALGWVTLPAPRKTSSPATPQPPSSKRSARSSSGSPRNRAPCRTSTADGPRPQVPSLNFIFLLIHKNTPPLPSSQDLKL
uniref:Uncharacterized protein n=1 Tax=Marmota marmota marmota TaxID=9994 RepID=A0A8C6ESW2_MARMA